MRLISLYDFCDHFGEFDQIFRSSDGPPVRTFDKRVQGARIGPGSRNIRCVACFREVVHPPLSPASAEIDQLKAPTPPGMEGMRDLEELLRFI